MNPNHFLAVAIGYLFGGHRPDWPDSARIGKTLVSSSMIDRVAESLGKPMVEVPVGFKWFVPGLLDGSFGFGGEESAGRLVPAPRRHRCGPPTRTASCSRCWPPRSWRSPGSSPSEHYQQLVAEPRRPGVRPDRRAGRPRAEGEAGGALARRRHRDLARGRGDHRPAHRGARQRGADRGAQGDDGERVVRGPSQRHRGRLQDLRGVVPRPRPPRAGAGGGPRGGLGGAGVTHPVVAAARRLGGAGGSRAARSAWSATARSSSTTASAPPTAARRGSRTPW